MVVIYDRPYKFFHENNFFEEGINYTICIDGNCVDVTGKLITHCYVSDVPHFREYTLSSNAIRKESVSFDS
ncbi:hypothetical protein [Wolbachia pipientis]|uniref:hypothetical protein n=1 Tax=Wolbachia pipientis TaxID=955 RepID=UPI0025A34C4F|nr:hypothetical protein [Wolbachia pipientis]MDM8334970.1 hypothetical protein [Wolbachia pipientis]